MVEALPDPPAVIGSSTVFRETLAMVSRLAAIDRPVLVIGERGTGKELIAARLHYLSPRWAKPFITVNCAALPPSLLEAELFGHEAGAFTGATKRRAGRFERADHGTLFLDEIATASPAVQEALLRVVEYGRFDVVGGGSLRTDARIVAATNADLPAMAAAGQFRADLLDRLAFEVVTIPPLRARPGDVIELARHFGLGMVREMGGSIFAGFTPAAEAALEAHPWPGNVRELRNTVERSVFRAERLDQPIARIILDPFAVDWRTPNPAVTAPPAATTIGLSQKLEALTRNSLADALARNRYNQRRTASELGLSYDALRRLVRRHALGAR